MPIGPRIAQNRSRSNSRPGESQASPGAKSSDPPTFLAHAIKATPTGMWPTKICAPGLTCRGLSNDGTLGVCATPEDVGGPCVQSAVINGCLLGLVCQCGACQLPPTRGPCFSGSCLMGVAYCDPKSRTCLPVKTAGGDCTLAGSECAPNLPLRRRWELTERVHPHLRSVSGWSFTMLR